MLALGLFALALFVVRLTGLPNLFDNECRLGESVLDVVQNGNWLCPHDALGHTDKPPLLAWLSALVTLVTGRVDRFTLYLPSAVATAALAGLVLAAGRRHFGWWAGFLGGLVYLASEIATKQVTTARWDALFALTVTLAALAAFCAWTTGRGWVWFWLAAAAATLTKGPLGVLRRGGSARAGPHGPYAGRRRRASGSISRSPSAGFCWPGGRRALRSSRTCSGASCSATRSSTPPDGTSRGPSRTFSATSPPGAWRRRSASGARCCGPRPTHARGASSGFSSAGWQAGFSSSASPRTRPRGSSFRSSRQQLCWRAASSTG